MTDIQASLGSKQMDRAQEIVKIRNNIAKKYNNDLSHLEWLKIPSVEKIFIMATKVFLLFLSQSQLIWKTYLESTSPEII